jgi:curved DNA-binding protein CbpA
MSCPFELLGLTRRPLLSEEEIGSAYRKMAGNLHPDQEGGDEGRFKELGEAAAILRDPARRLRFLSGVSPGSIPPPEAADLFSRVASLTRQADDLLGRSAAASNPLTKAVLATPLRKLSSDLDLLHMTIGQWQARLNGRLGILDAGWPDHDPQFVAELADSFSYATRWESQIRERTLALQCL